MVELWCSPCLKNHEEPVHQGPMLNYTVFNMGNGPVVIRRPPPPPIVPDPEFWNRSSGDPIMDALKTEIPAWFAGDRPDGITIKVPKELIEPKGDD